LISFNPINTIRCELGEGPVYDAGSNVLWYCDIPARTVHAYDLAGGPARHWKFPSEVGSLGLADSGRLVVALRHTVGLFDPVSETFDEIAHIEMESGADTRLNDGKVGPDGAFWVGTMDDRGLATREPIGALYRVAGDGSVERKVDNVMVSNGLAWTPDGQTMFHSDSSGQWVDRWDFDSATGAIGNRKRIATLDEATGRPDGAACDAEGYYWSAGVSAARLNRIDREGTIVASYPVPVAAPTMPCFGGPDLRTLFVTSLRTGRSPEMLEKYPLTGITIMGESPVAGAPVGTFRDE
jgi:sugar lactone lactonase YvrE